MRPILTLLTAFALTWAGASHAALIGLYTFEGNANDVSGNANHGVVMGGASLAAGFQGQAYAFGGAASNDFIALPFGINPATYPQLTMGAWVNTNVLGGPPSSVPKAISHDDGSFDRTLGIDFREGCCVTGASEWAAFGGGAGVVDSGIGVTTGQWVFLAAVYDQVAATVRLYVNDMVTTQAGASLGSSSLNVVIGKNPGFGSNEHWDGLIDNVFFFDTALTDAEIETIRLDPDSLLPDAVPEPGTVLLVGAGLLGLRRSVSRRR